MKLAQRLGAIFIALVIFVGLIPVQAFALADPSLPTVDPEELVIDFGKTVAIEEANLKKHIHLNGGAKSPTLVGVVATGTNGQLLTAAPSGMGCTATSGTGSTLTTTKYTVTRNATQLLFTPKTFLDGTAYFYAVYSLTGITQTHILVEVRVIPATSMYYEAEDFKGSEIQTMNTTDGGITNLGWGTDATDGTTSDTTQSFEQVGDANYDLDYATSAFIPGTAFFVDFDGTGNTNRYQKNPIYRNSDFDTVNYWINSGTKDAINQDSGLMTVTLTSGQTSHYVQTATKDGGAATDPLLLRPNYGDTAIIRLAMKNCTKSGTPTLTVYLSKTSETDVNTSNGKTYTLTTDQSNKLVAGEFVTLTVDIGSLSYYNSGNQVYSLRFTVGGVKSASGSTMLIDYIYVGPKSGLTVPEVGGQTQYLFFGFDKNYQDTRQHLSSYGSKDYSSTSNWKILEDSKNMSLSTSSPGYITFADNKSWTSSNGYHYNSVQTGTSWSDDTMKYTPNKDDICQIRFKIVGGSQLTSNTATVNHSGKCTFRLEGKAYNTNDSDASGAILYGYKTFTLSSYRDYKELKINLGDFDNWNSLVDSGKKLGSIRPTFFNIDSGTYYIDYIYIGPESRLTHATSPTKQAYFFVDFRYTTNDSYRYANATYGFHNFDKLAGMTTADTTTMTVDNTEGNRYLTLKKAKGVTGNVYAYFNNISITGSSTHYLQMRVKISGDVAAVADDTNGPRIAMEFRQKQDTSVKKWTAVHKIDLSKDKNKWLTITIPMNKSNGSYYNGIEIDRIAPALLGTTGATFTIDYIYVGPAVCFATNHVVDPTTNFCTEPKSLYFGFNNTAADKLRYGAQSAYAYNGTYRNVNHDTSGSTGYWATSTNTNATTTEFSIDNTQGIASVYVSANQPLGSVHGPYFTTTSTNGTHSYSKTYATLRYRPMNSQIFQIRFRLRDCTVPSGKIPNLIFLWGGYNEAGTYENYSTDNASGNDKYPYSQTSFADTDEFQTITIPVQPFLTKFVSITNLGIRFQNVQGKNGAQTGYVDIDYMYLGPGSTAPDPVYGYDASYTNDTQLSNGKSMFVNGKGVRLETDTKQTAWTEASFTFTGTGFDLISRTDSQQGTIRLELTKVSTGEKIRTMTVNNKGDLELYQIPIVSVNGLDHGEYKVTFWVNKKVDSSYEILKRGDEFYLDAVRVYDTINVKGSSLNAEQKAALYAYRGDKEAFAFVREIRDSLLTSTEFSTGKYHTSNALFIDTKKIDTTLAPDDIKINSNLALNVATYNKIGPKNEIYLSPGQAVAFKMNWGSGTPVGIDIGAKTVLGADGSAVLAAGFVTSVDLTTQDASGITKTIQTINTATNLYYPLDISSAASGSYLVVYNASTGTDRTKNILSITDLKVCYNTQPSNLPSEGPKETYGYNGDVKPATRDTETVTEPYRFEVDEQVPQAVALFIGGFYETHVEDDGPAVDETLKMYHSLNLASDISVNFLVPVAALEAYDDFNMEFRLCTYGEAGSEEYSYMQPEAVKNGDYYYFTLSNLTAVQMNDEIEATLYMTKDGKDYYSLTDTYSIADYAYGQLAKDNAPDGLKTLCADLLVYGAKAQLYKDYRTDSLADMAMTDVQRVYCSDLDAVVFGNTNVTGAETEDPTVIWAGKALELNSRVSVIYCVDLSGFLGSPEELTMKISYLDLDGVETTVTLRDPVPYEGKENCYKFTFDGLLAAELRTVLTAQAYVGDEAVSNSLTYSPDTYGNNKTGILAELCKALFAYSDSAKAYFSN